MSTAQDRPLVLVTGSSGLIGTRVARALIEDHRVVGLDVVDPPDAFPDEAGFVECDLTDDAKTDAAVRQVVREHGDAVASVVHLAAYYDFSGEPSPLYQELTVLGTRRLVKALREHTHTEQIVFSSSLLVMKPVEQEGEVIDEESDVRAEWEYPKSKLEAEAALRETHGDVRVVVLRIAGAYDAWGHSPPITQQIWRIREKKLESFLFPGDRAHGQSFVHLDDIASCIRATVLHRAELGPWEVFLVGEPQVLAYGELQDRIGEAIHGREWPTIRIPASVAKAGAWAKEKLPGVGEDQFIKPWMVDMADAHYPVSVARAKQRLAWEPRHRLADVLPDMLANLARDPKRFYRINDLPDAEDAEAEEESS